MKEKILIIGSNGLLGQTLLGQLQNQNEYKIIATSRGKNRHIIKIGYTYKDIDITKSDELSKYIKDLNPTYIINTAAITNVDYCETHKLECDEVNVESVKTIIDCCRELNSHLIHISTDFIFDGKKGYYKEDDVPNPVNYYGLSKLKSENAIKDSNINFTILRTILVYGSVDNMNKSNIVLWIKDNLEKGKTINVVDDQYRMPTYVQFLAKACIKSIYLKKFGIYNISSNELISIYELSLIVAEVFRLNPSYINKISSSQLNAKAKRPAKTGFNLIKMKSELQLESNSFKEDLQKFKIFLK